MRHLASRRPLGAVYTPLPEHSLGRVIDEAESLWPQAPSEAIGLLFRGLLARLAMDYQLLVPPGATEPELVEQVASLRLSGLEDFTRRLAEHWQQARYAGALPSDAAWAGLCVSWRRLFPTDVAA
nr:DUF4129 domain-containing protein [Pseudomonas sp. RIT-PI-S]